MDGIDPNNPHNHSSSSSWPSRQAQPPGDGDGHGLGHGHGHAPRQTVTVDEHGPRDSRYDRKDARGRPRANDLHRLDVYRCALELYRVIGRIVAQFPRGEADLRNQMKRAARSVPFNIGEGVGKRGKARAAAYQIALGEAKELIVALDCTEIDELAPTHEIHAAQHLADRVSAMLTKLIRSTETQRLR